MRSLRAGATWCHTIASSSVTRNVTAHNLNRRRRQGKRILVALDTSRQLFGITHHSTTHSARWRHHVTGSGSVCDSIWSCSEVGASSNLCLFLLHGLRQRLPMGAPCQRRLPSAPTTALPPVQRNKRAITFAVHLGTPLASAKEKLLAPCSTSLSCRSRLLQSGSDRMQQAT